MFKEKAQRIRFNEGFIKIMLYPYLTQMEAPYTAEIHCLSKIWPY